VVRAVRLDAADQLEVPAGALDQAVGRRDAVQFRVLDGVHRPVVAEHPRQRQVVGHRPADRVHEEQRRP
jgi:hypothetical protein